MKARRQTTKMVLASNKDIYFAYLSESLPFNLHDLSIFDINSIETNKFNLGTSESPKEILIASEVTSEERKELERMLIKYANVFAWSYEDMPGVDRSITQHAIPTYPNMRLVKQKLRRMRPEWAEKVREEVKMQINVGFLEVVKYPEWLANIMPVPKKDGKVIMCVDYRDLNKACPKDDFPLPHIDVLVDSAALSAMYSFTDGFSGYNHVLTAEEDKHKTAFVTEWGTYCYKVMSFGLKNAGATYQRMATTLFHDLMYKEIEVYVDDMMVKSEMRSGHVDALEEFLQRVDKYNL